MLRFLVNKSGISVIDLRGEIIDWCFELCVKSNNYSGSDNNYLAKITVNCFDGETYRNVTKRYDDSSCLSKCRSDFYIRVERSLKNDKKNKIH